MDDNFSRILANTRLRSIRVTISPKDFRLARLPQDFPLASFPLTWNKLPQRYEVLEDPYYGVKRLNLYRFDGSPMNPMYLAYKPPQMLPTQTMNPTTSATGAAQARQTGKVKRGLEGMSLPLNKHALRKQRDLMDADKWWWFGVVMTALGSIGYFCF